LKLKLFITITLVYFAELLTDFIYTKFTVSYRDVLDRLRVLLNTILFLLVIIRFLPSSRTAGGRIHRLSWQGTGS